MSVPRSSGERRFRRHRRVRGRVRGSATRPRVSVHRSARYMTVQLINDDTGVTLVAVTSKGQATGSKTIQAEATGQALAKAAQAAGITMVVFDRSGYRYHGRVAAVAQGLRAGGLNF